MEEESWNSEFQSQVSIVNLDKLVEENENNMGQRNSRVSNYTDLNNNDFPQDIKTKEIQLRLWLVMLENDLDSIYELWYKKFDIFQKVSLWNSL
jgi:hypothetical protein